MEPSQKGQDPVLEDERAQIDPKRGPRVVVVGAGFAGVGAVGALRAGGILDVTLLEASERPGGRVKTAVLENGFLELGAQFLHGENEVFNIAEREGMLTEKEPDEEDLPDTVLQYRDFIFRTSDGEAVNPKTVKHNLQVLEDLQTAVNGALSQGKADDVNISVGQFFRNRYQTSRQSMLGSEDLKTAMFRKVSQHMANHSPYTTSIGPFTIDASKTTHDPYVSAEVLKWLEVWDCQDAGGEVDDMSVPGIGQYQFCPGSGTRETTSGMEAVFKCLLRDSVPPDCLRLNKAVKAIHWLESDSSQIVQSTVSGVSGPVKRQYGVNNNLDTGDDSASEQINAKVDDSVSKNEDGNELPVNTKSSAGCSSGKQRDFAVKENASDIKDDSRVNRRQSDFSVRLECEDGDVYFADHVIVTSSMGFLTSNPDFFQPHLPQHHQEAVSSMGFGNVAKMFLFWDQGETTDGESSSSSDSDIEAEWERNLFGEDVEGMIPLWLEDADTHLQSAKYTKKMSNGRHWYQDVCIFNVVESHDFTVAGWVGGEAAIIMESLPEAEVKDVLHELLALFLGKPDLPSPSRLLRTDWYSNPYIRGAYSYLATGVPLEVHQVLSQPVPSLKNPVIQLAGEACSKHYFSTAHGALQSGQDAARAIVRHHGLKQQ